MDFLEVAGYEFVCLKCIHYKRLAFWIFTLHQSNTFFRIYLTYLDCQNLKIVSWISNCKCIRIYEKAHLGSDFRIKNASLAGAQIQKCITLVEGKKFKKKSKFKMHLSYNEYILLFFFIEFYAIPKNSIWQI